MSLIEQWISLYLLILAITSHLFRTWASPPTTSVSSPTVMLCDICDGPYPQQRTGSFPQHQHLSSISSWTCQEVRTHLGAAHSWWSNAPILQLRRQVSVSGSAFCCRANSWEIVKHRSHFKSRRFVRHQSYLIRLSEVDAHLFGMVVPEETFNVI